MVKNLLLVCSLAVAIFTTVLGFKIQNKLVGKCLQVQEGTWRGRVSLGECSPYSPMQEWLWIPESQALSSQHTGECLTAPEGEYEGVHLQPCMFKMDSGETGDQVAAVDVDSEESRQTWSCAKKGLLTLTGRGLHLSASAQSTLVFVSRDHKQGSRWRTLDNQTLCNLRNHKHHQPQDQSHDDAGKSPEARIFPSSTADLRKEAEPLEDRMDNKAPETYLFTDGNVSSQSTNSSSADPKMIFLSMDYGMAWKITMLVLSSLALVLGTVILIVNVHSNRRKKVVCVLKSYAVRPERSVPGSPAPSERAPLTEHAMRLPQSSPTMQRGEILIQWKDGSVTPLYEA